MVIDDNKVLSLIVDEGNDITYLADIEDYTLYFLNKTGMELVGLSSEEQWYGKPCYEVLQNRESPCPFCKNHLLQEGSFYEWDFYNEALKRRFMKKCTLVNYKGRKARMEFAIDITEVKRMEDELTRELQVNRVLMECALTFNRGNGEGDEAIRCFLDQIIGYYDADRVFIYEIDGDAGRICYTYEICRQGVEAQIDKLKEFPLSAVYKWIEESEESDIYRLTSLDELDKSTVEYRVLKEQGINSLLAAPLMLENRLIGFLGVENPLKNQDVEALLKSAPGFIVNDIHKRRIQKDARRSGYLDELTGLGNRKQYCQVISWLEKEHRGEFGIVSVDIDSLRTTNNAYGYKWGDHILCYVADTLRKRFGDRVYRIGDDEFVAFCLDISKEDFLQKVKELQNSAKWDEQLRISIGSSWFDRENDIDYQIAVANEKMYINKVQNYRKGHHDGEDIHRYRGVLADELQKDIENGHFVVYLQPQIHLKTGEIGGAEALVRRVDSKGNIIFPNSFISRYENEEIIRYVDFYVLQQVCKVIKSWEETGKKSVGVAVNFSRVTMMEDGVAEKMKTICKNQGISPERITIEVTESIGTLERDILRNLLEDIQKAGFRISLDDFGSRYSDLALLSLANFDELKLDKSLIDRLESGGKSRIIAEYVLRMCMELNDTHSVAEGIETVSQKEILKSFGCELGQGFLFDKALTVQEFEKKYMEDEA